MSRWSLFGVGLLLTGVSIGQGPTNPDQPAIRLVEPSAESFLLGDVALKAAVSPEDADVLGVEFFIDGSPACRASAAPFECTFSIGEKLASHMVRAVATLRNGRTLAVTTKTASSLSETVNVRAVLVPAVVTDYRGNFVSGLKQGSFIVFENGTPQPIASLQAENVPVDVVLAIDISGSMLPSMPKLKATVKRFIEALNGLGRTNTQVSVTVLAFNDQTHVIAKPGQDLHRQLADIDALKAFGRTSLYDAMDQGIQALGTGISRKTIIVFTDGADTASLSAIEPLERRIHESDAVVYAITQGKGAELDAVRKIVNRLADISGGRAFPTEKIDQLERALSYVMDDLTHQYLIAYNPTNQVRDGKYRKITVKTNVNSHEVRARDGYWAK